MNRFFNSRGSFTAFISAEKSLADGEVFLQLSTEENTNSIKVYSHALGVYTPTHFRKGDIFIGGDYGAGSASVYPTMFRNVQFGQDGTSGTYTIAPTDNSYTTVKTALLNYQPGDILYYNGAENASKVTTYANAGTDETYLPHKGDVLILLGDPTNIANLETFKSTVLIIKSQNSDYLQALADGTKAGQYHITEHHTNVLSVVKALADSAMRAGKTSGRENGVDGTATESATSLTAVADYIASSNSQYIHVNTKAYEIAGAQFKSTLDPNDDFFADGSFYKNDSAYAIPVAYIYKASATAATAAEITAAYASNTSKMTTNVMKEFILPDECFVIYNGKVHNLGNSSELFSYFTHIPTASTSDGTILSYSQADTDQKARLNAITTVEEALKFLERWKADVDPQTGKIYTNLLPEALLGALKYSGSIGSAEGTTATTDGVKDSNGTTEISLATALNTDDAGATFIKYINNAYRMKLNSITGSGCNIIYGLGGSEQNGQQTTTVGQYYVYNGAAIKLSATSWLSMSSDGDTWLQPGDWIIVDEISSYATTANATEASDATVHIVNSGLYEPATLKATYVESADAISSIYVKSNVVNATNTGDTEAINATIFSQLTLKDAIRKIANKDADVTTAETEIQETQLSYDSTGAVVAVNAPDAVLALDDTSTYNAWTYIDKDKIRRTNQNLRFTPGTDDTLLIGHATAGYTFAVERIAANTTKETTDLTTLKTSLATVDLGDIAVTSNTAASTTITNFSLPTTYEGTLATVTMLLDMVASIKKYIKLVQDFLVDTTDHYIPLAVNSTEKGVVKFVNSAFKQNVDKTNGIIELTVTPTATVVDEDDFSQDAASTVRFQNSITASSAATPNSFPLVTAAGNDTNADGAETRLENSETKIVNVLPNHSGVLLNSNSVIDGGIYVLTAATPQPVPPEQN